MEQRRPPLGEVLSTAGMFIRFSTLGISIIMALFGAVSVTAAVSGGIAISGRHLALVLLGAIAFHNFAYVLNDIVDLPLDRTDPRRVHFPLVRGLISPRQALFFVSLQILIAFAVTFRLGGTTPAFLALAAAFFFMAIYDVWGKRCFLPPLTDLAQGIGWGCLALWAAALMPGSLSGLSWVLFGYLTLFIVLINGLHGSFRDLANDYKHGVRSTAILLGVRPQGADGLIIPRHVRLYAALLQGVLIGIAFLPFLGKMLDYSAGRSLLTIAALLLCGFTAWRLMVRALDAAAYRPQMLAVGTLHILSMLGMLVALFFFRLSGGQQVITLAIFLVPLLTHTWIRNTLRWIVSGKGAEALSASDFPLPDPEPNDPLTLPLDPG